MRSARVTTGRHSRRPTDEEDDYLHPTACQARGGRCNEPSAIVLFVPPACGRKSEPRAGRVVVDSGGSGPGGARGVMGASPDQGLHLDRFTRERLPHRHRASGSGPGAGRDRIPEPGLRPPMRPRAPSAATGNSRAGPKRKRPRSAPGRPSRRRRRRSRAPMSRAATPSSTASATATPPSGAKISSTRSGPKRKRRRRCGSRH